jgi:probable rRNA maturation factor
VSELVIRNRQRVRAVNVPLLRRLTRHVLEKELDVEEYELGCHLVGANEMARLNKGFLQHEGSTDVITFNYREPAAANAMHGEIFICVADAVKQAREFNETWQSEVMRYVIHGLLHLCGHDDLEPTRRRSMKREEDRLLKIIASEFGLRQLARSVNHQ